MSKEFDRLSAVARFAKLDAGINKDLNEIVELLAEVCDVPVAIISLMDDTMQWFKASVGTGEAMSNERHLSFCNKTVVQNDALIVQDATRDDRFAKLPVVVDNPHVRFYAGVPLVTYDGYAVGTVCVIDTKPRQISDQHLHLLKVMSKQVLNLMELSWSLETLSEQNAETLRQKQLTEDSEIKLKAIFNSATSMHLLIGKNMEVLAFNRAAETYVKNYHAKQIRTGAYVLNFLTGTYHTEFLSNAQKALQGEHLKVEWLLDAGMPTERWLEMSFIPVADKNDLIIGTAIDVLDITQNKKDSKFIEQQNAAIQRISTIQSNELRKPIASLLGLVEVIKLEENIPYDAYLNMIEKTVHELDDKVNHIIEESEAIIENQIINNPLQASA